MIQMLLLCIKCAEMCCIFLADLAHFHFFAQSAQICYIFRKFNGFLVIKTDLI